MQFISLVSRFQSTYLPKLQTVHCFCQVELQLFKDKMIPYEFFYGKDLLKQS